jgi:hypothetical protein
MGVRDSGLDLSSRNLKELSMLYSELNSALTLADAICVGKRLNVIDDNFASDLRTKRYIDVGREPMIFRVTSLPADETESDGYKIEIEGMNLSRMQVTPVVGRLPVYVDTTKMEDSKITMNIVTSSMARGALKFASIQGMLQLQIRRSRLIPFETREYPFLIAPTRTLPPR